MVKKIVNSILGDKELILIIWRLAVIIGFAGWIVVGSVLGFMVQDIYGRVEKLETVSPANFEFRIAKLENSYVSKNEFLDTIKIRDEIRNGLVSRMERIDVDNKQDHACISAKLEVISSNMNAQFIDLHKYLRDHNK